MLTVNSGAYSNVPIKKERNGHSSRVSEPYMAHSSLTESER